jgi:ankyrin repeat protein
MATAAMEKLSLDVHNLVEIAVVDGSDEARAELEAFLDAHPEVDVNLLHEDDMGQQSIHRASEKGDAACVRILLAHGANLHARDTGGGTPFMTACEFREDLECVQVLIEANADLDATDNIGKSAIHYASRVCGQRICTHIRW